jgi:hypothetical protein
MHLNPLLRFCRPPIAAMNPLAWKTGHTLWKGGHLSWGCPSSPTTACGFCDSSLAAATYRVSFSGIGENATACGSCASLNTSYVVSRLFTDCFFIYQFPSSICNFNEVQLHLGPTQIQVDLSTSLANPIFWILTSPPTNCRAYSSLNIPWSSDSGGAACTGAASTCHITAL